MTRKKLFFIVLLLIIILSAMLVGCVKEKSVIKIQVIELQGEYQQGDRLNLDNAKILVTYDDNTTTSVNITEAMVSGFNTSSLGTQKKMTISYRGASVLYTYNVRAQASSDTPFRLNLSATEGEGEVEVLIKGDKVESIKNGIYALRFDITLTGFEFSNISSLMGQDFDIIHNYDKGLLSVVIYTKKGDNPFTSSGEIIKINLTKRAGSSNARITLSNIQVSDGEKDYVKIPIPPSIIF